MDNKLEMYPVLSKDFLVSRVITEKKDDTVIYNTKTRIRAYPNTATYEFTKRCTGYNTLQDIISDLSCISGEEPQKIKKSLLSLIKTMEDNTMISFLGSPLYPPRVNPPEVHLFKRITSIIFEITNKCNLRCNHCYNDSGAKRDKELTFEEIKRSVDTFADAGVLNIVISGGEPLLHNRIFDIIQYIRSKPMSCIIFTNGTQITEDIAKKFKEYSIVSVAISIDGATPETNDSFRGIPGSFEKTVKAINLLQRYEIPVRINVCLHKGILDEFDKLLTLFTQWDVTDYSVAPAGYTGRIQESDFVITPEEYKKALKQLKEHEFKRGKKNELPYVPNSINCGAGMNSLTIRSNGDITLCSPFPDELSLGNIKTDSIIDIWNNSKLLHKIRSINASESEMCKGCNHIMVCQGGCMAHNYRRTGELGCGDPYECAYFEVYTDYTPVEFKRQSHLSVEIR
ncbi:MAG: radical SAM protein [Candidatus Methanofastidiosia archaeon]